MYKNGILAAVAVLGIAIAVAGCGGGSSGYGGGGSTGGPPPDPTYTAGVYPAPSSLAAYCANPRTGTDPSTHAAYPDRPGSAVWEKFWIRSWSNAYYLWYRDLPDVDPTFASNTTAHYFQLMKTSALNPSGTPKDKPNFHFTYATAQWEALSQAGVQAGYGATWSVIRATAPNREVLVAYTEPASAGYPATGANLARGAAVLTVDGVDLVNAADQASVDTLNAGLFPATVGESHTFTILDAGATQSRAITLKSVNVTETPVPDFQAPPVVAGSVGYLLFNDHIATAEPELATAIGKLAVAGIKDLVLDIRYNGGGFLDIASELAYMVAGPGVTSGKTFELIHFNDRYPGTDPFTGQAVAPTPFWSQTQGFSGLAGQMLPSLGLPRVFVLTGNDTCSASEAIINGLIGVGVQVILVGSQTCGKPYGFFPQDNCGTTYFSIEFQGTNAQNFGDYPDGFVAMNTTSTSGYPLPGCSVADDLGHALGDPAEGRLATALAYIAGQGCPAASGLGAPPNLIRVEGHVAKPEWLRNRILRHPR